jgi:hypothetical protein
MSRDAGPPQCSYIVLTMPTQQGAAYQARRSKVDHALEARLRPDPRDISLESLPGSLCSDTTRSRPVGLPSDRSS